LAVSCWFHPGTQNHGGKIAANAQGPAGEEAASEEERCQIGKKAGAQTQQGLKASRVEGAGDGRGGARRRRP